MGTLIVGLAVLALVAGIIAKLVRDRRAGRRSCGASGSQACGSCGLAGACADGRTALRGPSA